MRIYIAILVALIPNIAMSSQPQNKIIKTPDGAASTTTTTVESVPQKIILARPSEIKEFNAYAAKGTEFVSTYLQTVKDPTLKDFDEAFHIWKNDKKQRHSQQQVVEILGSYIGNKLIKDFNMEWVVVTDEYGTDYAVRSKQYEVLSFPFSSVLKRIESNQQNFVVGVYYAVKDSIEGGEFKKRSRNGT